MADIPEPPRMRTMEEVYGAAFAEEEAFEAALAQSLSPRGFELLFDLVAGLSLPPGSAALDVGARDGWCGAGTAPPLRFQCRGVDTLG